MRMLKSTATIGAVALLLSGCVTTEEEWARIEEWGEQRTGQELAWDMEGDGSPIIMQRVKDLLADGLTEDEAVQVALLNNKLLQAQFENIGIAKSEYVQASLLSNPQLRADIRFPGGGGFTMAEGGLVWNIADLWIVPFDKEFEAAQLEATLAEVANEVIHTAAQTRHAYWDLLIALEQRDYVARHVRLYEEMLEQVKYRYQFGLHNDFEVMIASANAWQQQVELARLEAEVTRARARLNAVMALKEKLFDYTFRPEDREVAILDIDPAKVLPYAYDHRFDVVAPRLRVAAGKGLVDLERARIFDIVRIGGSYEQGGGQDVSVLREGTDYEKVRVAEVHERAYGIGLGIELPIFDQNQAQIAKAKFRLRKAQKLLMFAKNTVRRDVYDDLARASFHARHATIFRDRIQPLMADAMAYTNEYFDAMRMDVLTYLNATDRMLRSHLEYLAALHDLRTAIIDFEQHVGGSIPAEWYSEHTVSLDTPLIHLLGANVGDPRAPLQRRPEATRPPLSPPTVLGFTKEIVLTESGVHIEGPWSPAIWALRIRNDADIPLSYRIEGGVGGDHSFEPLSPGETRMRKIHFEPGDYRFVAMDGVSVVSETRIDIRVPENHRRRMDDDAAVDDDAAGAMEGDQ